MLVVVVLFVFRHTRAAFYRTTNIVRAALHCYAVCVLGNSANDRNLIRAVMQRTAACRFKHNQIPARSAVAMVGFGRETPMTHDVRSVRSYVCRSLLEFPIYSVPQLGTRKITSTTTVSDFDLKLRVISATTTKQPSVRSRWLTKNSFRLPADSSKRVGCNS